MNFLNKYWILILFVTWMAYKWWQSKKIMALLPDLRQKGALFIDVRSSAEFSSGNAPETINIPLQDIKNRLHQIPKTSPIVLCCASGTRSSMAKMTLKKNGYIDVYNIGPWQKLLSSGSTMKG